MIDRIKEFFEQADDEPINFDIRYNNNIKEKISEKRNFYKNSDFFKDWTEENKKIIEKLKSKKNRAESLDYFDTLFTTNSCIKRLVKEKQKGKKIIGYFCNQIPEELIYAAGAVPIRLCSGCNNSIKPAEEVYPKDSCPLIKSSLGYAVVNQHFFDLCDVLIIPTTCDGKKKMGEFLNDYKPVWVLDLPHSKDRIFAKKYWLSEIRILKKRLEELTENKINKDRLKNAILLLRNKNKIIRTLMEIKKHEKQVITGSDTFIVIQASFFDEINNWIEKAEKLLKELEKNLKKSKLIKPENCTRILFTGSPSIMPNLKIPLIIEEFNANIIIDDTCGGTQSFYDPVVVDEWNINDMIKAISERYLMPSVCPCFIKSEDRIDKILDMIKEYNIKGVIYNTLRLCVLFDVESFKIKAILEDKKIPFLSLNTDYGKEDQEQLKTRIEAFLEIINEY